MVYNIENTGADCEFPSMPTFSELPEVKSLRYPFEFADVERRMKNLDDWRCRRAEIGAEIMNWEPNLQYRIN